MPEDTQKLKGTELVTPVLTKDVSFNEKVEDVDKALKGRAAAQKQMKTTWAAVVKVLTQYDQKAPSRRVDAGAAANLVNNLEIYKPKPELDKDLEWLARHGAYEINNLHNHPRTMERLEKKFAGLGTYFAEVAKANELIREDQEVDKPKTQEARKALQAVVDKYVEAIEAYDETIESVANVKEYIGVMKDIADISAIAQGMKS